MPPHNEPYPKSYNNSSNREEDNEARSRSMRRGGRGRRRATADGAAAGSRGFLAMVMTSLPRRLEARSRLVERVHVRELLHVRLSSSSGLFLLASYR